MTRLNGQNFRILMYNSTAGKYNVIGMATNCTVTLNGNADDASHKDVVGGATKSEVTSKSWQVSVESLSVADAAAMLTAAKGMQAVQLMWDETSTTDNQTLVGADFSRKGLAYINDISIRLDDRTNSVKSLQFTGTGALEKLQTTPSTATVTAGSFTKGQFVRLFLSSDNTNTPAKVVAAARSLTLHLSVSLENASTKDTDGDWQIQEPTGYSYDISSDALMRSGDTITSAVDAQAMADIIDIYEGSAPVKWQIANVSGSNQRTKGSVIASGSAIITQLTLTAQNRQAAIYTTQLTGYGEIAIGA